MAWNVTIEIREGDHGPIVDTILTHNLVVDSGLLHLRDILGYSTDVDDQVNWVAGGYSAAVYYQTPQYMAVGTGATAPAAGNTTLGTEVLRKEITRRYPRTKGVEFYLNLTTAEANGSSLTEVGLFAESADGTLWSRATHTAITKTVAISVQYCWTWTFGAP